MGLLPDKNKPNIPRQFLEEYNVLVFGEPGVGKTSFAKEFNDSMLTLFEDGTKSMLTYDVNLLEKANELNKMQWEVFKLVIDEFEQGGHPYKTLAIDTATRSYDAGMEYMIKVELGGKHPSQTENNIGYSLLNTELERTYNRVLLNRFGTIITAHAKYKQIQDIKGNKRHKLVPDTGGSFGDWLTGEVDIIIFYDRDEDGNRVLRLEGTKDYDAKQRLQFPDGDIDAGDSPKEAYQNFKKAFDKAIKKRNKEEGVTQEMIDKYYAAKKQKDEKKEKLIKIKKQIETAAKDKGLNRTQNKMLMKKEVGIAGLELLNNIKLGKKYLKFLKEEYKTK